MKRVCAVAPTMYPALFEMPNKKSLLFILKIPVEHQDRKGGLTDLIMDTDITDVCIMKIIYGC